MDQIKLLCDVVLVLEKGEVATMAEPETAIQCYYDLMRQRTEKRRIHAFAGAPGFCVSR